MRRSSSRAFQPFLILLTLLLATSANAGYWDVEYNLAPGSVLTTVAPGGPYTDVISGNMRMRYDAASTGAPITAAHLMAAQIDGTISQSAGLLTLTGSNMNTVRPGVGGTPAAIAGAALTLGVIADHDQTGFLHCYDLTMTALSPCPTGAGFTASVPVPQNSTGTFTLPKFNFGATAGVGNFTSSPKVTVIPGVATISAVYVGAEVSRIWVANSVPIMGSLGLGLLGSALFAGGSFGARRRA